MNTAAVILTAIPITAALNGSIGNLRTRIATTSDQLAILLFTEVIEYHPAVDQLRELARQGHGTTKAPVRDQLLAILAPLADELAREVAA